MFGAPSFPRKTQTSTSEEKRFGLRWEGPKPKLVGGFKHFLFSIIYRIILAIDIHIFQDCYCTTNQKSMLFIFSFGEVAGKSQSPVIFMGKKHVFPVTHPLNQSKKTGNTAESPGEPGLLRLFEELPLHLTQQFLGVVRKKYKHMSILMSCMERPVEHSDLVSNAGWVIFRILIYRIYTRIVLAFFVVHL